ncbi:hypothetical protein JM93_02295 [Roseibium hamelinense]|uniref:DUF2946 domain-containing protein n=1 Tax=Roseibium hamelinense TaxID=150831 RepID=A0A562T1M5_9HYPH|nr:hypothetical protein JM93_02295 [Roseibium hamelinense]
MKGLGCRFRSSPRFVFPAGARRALLCVLFIPYIFLALLPNGFMPGVGSDGRFSIVICTGDGLQTVFLNTDGTTDPDSNNGEPRNSAAHSICGFYAVAAAAILPSIKATFLVDTGRHTQTADCLGAPVKYAALPPVGARAPPHSL